MSLNDCSHILVFAQSDGRNLSPPTLQVLGKARELADQLGVYVLGLLCGEDISPLGKEMIAFGADRAILAEHSGFRTYETLPFTECLIRTIERERPEIVLFGSNPVTWDLAPRAAQRLGTGLVSECAGLAIDTEERLLVCTRTYYGGRLAAELVMPKHRPQMAILKAGSFVEPFRDDFREGNVERVS